MKHSPGSVKISLGGETWPQNRKSSWSESSRSGKANQSVSRQSVYFGIWKWSGSKWARPHKARFTVEVAAEHGTSESYVYRAEQFAKGVEAAEEAVPGAQEEILSGKIRATDREISSIAKVPKEKRPEVVAELRKSKAERDSSITDSYSKDNEFITTFKQDIRGIRKDSTRKKNRISRMPSRAFIHLAVWQMAKPWCVRFRARRRILSGGGKCVFVNIPIFLPNRKTMRSCWFLLTVPAGIFRT